MPDYDATVELTGSEFKWIRTQAGFRRRDLADVIAAEPWRQRIRTIAGVRYLESMPRVKDRYVGCLVKLLGRTVFERWYARVVDRRQRRLETGRIAES